jgi:uncharacterized protein YpmS
MFTVNVIDWTRLLFILLAWPILSIAMLLSVLLETSDDDNKLLEPERQGTVVDIFTVVLRKLAKNPL